MYEEHDALYRLLPAYLRSRDMEGEGPLHELCTIVGHHARSIEQDIVHRMYDDAFIETCQDWVVPYIGDLLGYERMPIPEINSNAQRDSRLAKLLSPRREVANLIRYRRRKGTLWLLEELARDVANWPAHAVEFYRLLARTEHLDHPQPQRLATVDTRNTNLLDLADSPFISQCHTVDVRRLNNEYATGRYNIPNVGLFVFRTKRYSVTRTSAYSREDVGLHCFTFSILGNDAPVYRLPVPENEPTHIAEEANFAVPIRRQNLQAVAAENARHAQSGVGVNQSLYGEGKSLVIHASNWPKKGDGIKDGNPQPIAAQMIMTADLSNWSYQVPRNHVAVDPVLGRIQFPKSQVPRSGVSVSYGYGFLSDIGGGEYDRSALPLPAQKNHFHVSPDLKKEQAEQGWFITIDAAYQYWRTTLPDSEISLDEQHKTWRPALLIELAISGVYKGRIDIGLNRSELVCVRASTGARPIIWLSDENPGGSDSVSVRGDKGSRVIFDGIMITGRGVDVLGSEISVDEKKPGDVDLCEVDVDLCEVVFRHSTLVPGWSLNCDCEPRRVSEPSILIDNSSARIRVESSIVGAIQVNTDPSRFDPTPIIICDSIVDATSDSSMAIGSSGQTVANAELRIARSTIVGEVLTHAIVLVENSLLTSRVQVARKQVGCIRYSHVPIGSRTPRRYHCQPESEAATQSDVNRLAPCFDSMRYGTSNYLRLSPSAASEIKQGADDKSEMGVYHDLFEPQRFALLTRRLEEFVPANTDSAVIFAS